MISWFQLAWVWKLISKFIVIGLKINFKIHCNCNVDCIDISFGLLSLLHKNTHNKKVILMWCLFLTRSNPQLSMWLGTASDKKGYPCVWAEAVIKKTAINAEKFKRDRPINRPTNWRKKWGVVSRSMWLKIQTNEDNIDTQSKSFK